MTGKALHILFFRAAEGLRKKVDASNSAGDPPWQLGRQGFMAALAMSIGTAVRWMVLDAGGRGLSVAALSIPATWHRIDAVTFGAPPTKADVGRTVAA